MNPHFERNTDRRADIPRRAYARVDHLERNALQPGFALVGVDLIDADWLDRRGQDEPLLDIGVEPEALSLRWQRFSRAVRKGSPNPLEQAPLYRLELEVEVGDSLAQGMRLPPPNESAPGRAIAAFERQWLEIELSPGESSDNPALLYGGLFAIGTPVIVKGALPARAKIDKALAAMFDLRHLPHVDASGLEALLGTQIPTADVLAVFDVGQGNANALAEHRGHLIPSLYYDLGAGVYRNAKTTPPDLRFCFTSKPRIILSHWDTDHWAGAYARRINGAYPALERTWIAPLQDVSTTHLAFAYDVITSGGELFIYTGSGGSSGAVPLPGGRVLRFARGTDSDRNGSGLVIAVEDQSVRPNRCWLLTGDCDYLHIRSTLNPANIVGMVAPHHGASLDPSSTVPPRLAGSYRRLVYSFGYENAHGSKKPPTRHPTVAGVAAHRNAHWDHVNWRPTAPGSPLPAGDVLATCEHYPGTRRGGAIIGWSGPPGPVISCPFCSTPCPQR